jgi:hypothetical protein
MGKTIDEICGFRESDVNFVANNFAAVIHKLRNREATLAALHPSTEAQTQALATDAMSFVAVAVGALAVASATYLIFDLSGPYSGIFRASSGRSNKCWRSWAKSDRFEYVVTMSSL